jgi:RNA polymerase sigma-70 factor (ECF subfamily)
VKEFADFRVLNDEVEGSSIVKEEWTDEQLMDALKKGYVWAFDVLYARYYIHIFEHYRRTLSRRLGDVAADLTNDVFVKVLVNCHQFDPEQAKFRAWLFKIVWNHGADPFRSAEIFARSVASSIVEEPPTPFVDSILVTGFLDLLPAGERDVIQLLILQEMPAGDVARILNIPLGTVYRRKHSALVRLKKLVVKRPAAGAAPVESKA